MVIFGPQNHEEVKSADELKEKKIATVRKDAANDYLLEIGISKEYMIPQNNMEEALEIIKNGDLKYFAYGINTGRYLLKKKGMSHNLKPLFPLKKYDLFIGCNINSDQKILDELQAQLDKAKKEVGISKYTKTYLDI